MSWRVYFDGVSAYGELDSTISLGDGDTLEFGFRAQADATTTDHFITCDSATGDDWIKTKEGNVYRFMVHIAGTKYDSGISTEDLYDGDDHVVTIERDVANFIYFVDGVELGTDTAVSTAMDIDLIATDSTDFAPIELKDLVIGSSTYPVTSATGATWEDTSVNGNDITLTDTNTAFVSSWEWIGDFVDVDKTYTTQNGTVTEERRDCVRRRNVCGYTMDNPINKQAGVNSLAVSALNGGTESTMTPTATSASIDCDEEVFTPQTGTNIFIQSQKWVSYYISYPS